MWFKRTRAPVAPTLARDPAAEASARRIGSAEALNLIACSVTEAAHSARSDVEPGGCDNFVAGQMMAFGQIVASIERERDQLLQQLIREAGLHGDANSSSWQAERDLLERPLALSAEDLFRLAMDFRQLEAADVLMEAGEAAADLGELESDDGTVGLEALAPADEAPAQSNAAEPCLAGAVQAGVPQAAVRGAPALPATGVEAPPGG